MVLVNNMDSYFKRTPPDCSFYSRDYSEVPIHKELLYQTQYLRSMVKSAGFEIDIYRDKLEIFTELAKDELEAMVEFLYSGEIYCNQIVASQVSENLIDLLVFRQISYRMQSQSSTIQDFKKGQISQLCLH